MKRASGKTAPMSKLERSIFSTAQLSDERSSVYAIQTVLSVNPNFPQWSDCSWAMYGDCIKRWVEHPDRIGRADDSPKFKSAATAMDAWTAIMDTHRDRYRNRIIARFEVTLEILVIGDGR